MERVGQCRARCEGWYLAYAPRVVTRLKEERREFMMKNWLNDNSLA